MLGGTADLGATGTSLPNQPSQAPTPKCTSCHINFKDRQDQKAHMREPWHVYNIKRRIASLPPLSQTTFDLEFRKSPKETSSPSDSLSDSLEPNDSSTDDPNSDPPNTTVSASPTAPTHCLFCPKAFPPTTPGLTENLDHMRVSHGLFIPSPSRITDMPTFLSYLATVVKDWNECLYCGAVKHSTLSVQSHMRDKQHCMINLEREPEIAEFWEGGMEGVQWDRERASEEGEKKVVASRLHQIEAPVSSPSPSLPTAQKKKRTTPTPPPSHTTSSPAATQNSSITVHRHSSTASSSSPLQQLQSLAQSRSHLSFQLQNITPHQQKALILAEKKAQRSQDAARRAQSWIRSKGANTQKFDQLDCTKIGKRGKQDHRLMPR
ncbi:unnamed protein product [Periconia digitata]|uniref:C2H2-type domain-containing protein n=1 Tax=Periconia digitata TaxID=1303443 RepID=A0A9W4XNQ7_9PLEO|nr:unnamed protein product [Periconia digitata]